MDSVLAVTTIAPLNIDGDLYDNGTHLDVGWLVTMVGQATLETLVRIKALWPASEVVEKPNGHGESQPLWVAPDRATPTTRWMTMDEGDPFQVNNGIRAVGVRNPEGPQTPPVLNAIPDERTPRFTAEQV